jgi:hypothetical protein
MNSHDLLQLEACHPVNSVNALAQYMLQNMNTNFGGLRTQKLKNSSLNQGHERSVLKNKISEALGLPP